MPLASSTNAPVVRKLLVPSSARHALTCWPSSLSLPHMRWAVRGLGVGSALARKRSRVRVKKVSSWSQTLCGSSEVGVSDQTVPALLVRQLSKSVSSSTRLGALLRPSGSQDWLHKLENFGWLVGGWVSPLVSRPTVTRVTLDMPECKEP